MKKLQISLSIATIALASLLLMGQIRLVPVNILGAANTFSNTQVIARNGIATTFVDGLRLTNQNDATVGVPVQQSPSLQLCGRAYNSVSGLSEIDCVRMTMVPSNAAGPTSGVLRFEWSINGGAYSGQTRAMSFDGLQSTNVTPLSTIGFGGSNETLGTGTSPTISSGFGTSPSVVASSGSMSFTVNVGTGGTASAGVVGLTPVNNTAWVCKVENQTGVAANRANQRTVQTASTSTTVTVQNQTISTGAALAWTASDILVFSCIGLT